MPSGRFEVDPGDRWWTDEAHFPYFIRCAGGRLAGFALVRRGSRITGARDVMDVAEFFVVRGERRTGIGIAIAHALFDAFPGPWEIRVRRANAPALRFWSRAVGAVVEEEEAVATTRVTRDGVEWEVLRFESKATDHAR
jgi:predicted acetyltransferase